MLDVNEAFFATRHGDPDRWHDRAQSRFTGQPTGVRTLGLVTLGSACVTFVAIDTTAQSDAQIADQSAALSRIMLQGVLKRYRHGIGVINHREAGQRVTGCHDSLRLVTACIGMVCGTGVALPLLAI